MALEGGDHLGLRRGGIVTEADQGFRAKDASAFLRPQADTGLRQPCPGKKLARVCFARGRHVAVAQHARRCDGVAHQDGMAERDQRRDLRFRESAIAEIMAGIDQFDADGAAIDVAGAGPVRDAGVPGAAVFGHHRIDGAVFGDGVMGGDFRRRIAKPVERRFRARHAGIMQHQHVDGHAAPRIVIGRRQGNAAHQTKIL